MIRLGLLGFDAALAKSMSIAISSRAADVCQCVEPEAASMVLVDVDKLKDQSIWKNLARTYPLLLIAVSEHADLPAELREDFSSVITKPLRFTAMLATITATANKGKVTAHQISSPSVTGDLIDDGPKRRKSDVLRSQTEVDQDNFLLGLVLYSVQLDSADQYRFISLARGQRRTDGQWLVIDKSLSRVYLSINAKLIAHTAIMDFSHHDSVEEWINASQLAELKSRAVWDISIEEFIWVLTRDTVRNGRLKTFDPEQRFRLKCWPNLTRYSTGNRDIAMASFWVESNASAVELSKSLGISINEVLPFANCCFTCGLLETVDDPVALTTRKSEKGIKKVLSMILKKLDR